MNEEQISGLVSALFDNDVDAVAAFDTSLRLTYWSPAMERFAGIEREHALGRSLHDVFPGASREPELLAALSSTQRLLASPFGPLADTEQLDWYVTPVQLNMQVIGAVAVGRSQTARASIREQLEETEQRFRRMADSSPVMLWMSGTDAMCTFFNQTWLDFSGRSLEEELGVGWSEGVWPEDFEHCMTTFMRAFQAREAFEMEYRLRRKDGEYRWILDRGAPRYRESGEFAGFIGSCIDITDRKRAEDRARDSSQRLEQANAYMERLLYAASHDLREPIRMVRTFSELLQKNFGAALDARASTYITYALEGAQRMESLVDGLLSFARIRQSSQVTERVDMDAVVRGAWADLSLAAEEAGAALSVAEGLPAVRGDATQLRQVFQNLLANAIKFRGERPLSIKIGAQRSGEELRFAIEDNGIGFEQDYAERIFGMFARLHTRQDYPGDGIGLTIVKEIVERHGGRILATARPGEGATFSLTLPAAD